MIMDNNIYGNNCQLIVPDNSGRPRGLIFLVSLVRGLIETDIINGLRFSGMDKVST